MFGPAAWFVGGAVVTLVVLAVIGGLRWRE